MQYLALSYVWGQGPPEKHDYPHLPRDLSPTVEDAVTATVRLGFRDI